jgi:multiple sugar transport system permease protein
MFRSIRSRMRRIRDMPIYLLLLAPAVLFLGLTSLYPLAYTLRLSFFEWFLNRPNMEPTWVGTDNYTNVLSDNVFQTSATNTALFGVGTVLVELVLGLVLALAVAQEGKGMRVVRSILLIPMIMTPVVVGVLWRILLSDEGLVNYLLDSIGIGPVLWFVEPRWAFIAVMMVEIWEWTPFVLIVLTAAITALPSDPYRAAQIDGASRWQTFRYITLPMLWPVILVVALLRFMDAIKVFDIIYVLTSGGPGYATEMLSSFIYKQGLRYFDIGTASAASWLFLGAVVLLSIAIIRARARVTELD